MEISNASNPLDVFVTNETDRKILNIFATTLYAVSHRKRKAAYDHAASLLRSSEAPKFPHALAQSLLMLENQANNTH
jgi:hypothetical protein